MGWGEGGPPRLCGCFPSPDKGCGACAAMAGALPPPSIMLPKHQSGGGQLCMQPPPQGARRSVRSHFRLLAEVNLTQMTLAD